MAVQRYEYKLRVYPAGASEDEYVHMSGGWIEADLDVLNDVMRKFVELQTEILESPAEKELEAAWNRGAPGDRSEYLGLLEAPWEDSNG